MYIVTFDKMHDDQALQTQNLGSKTSERRVICRNEYLPSVCYKIYVNHLYNCDFYLFFQFIYLVIMLFKYLAFSRAQTFINYCDSRILQLFFYNNYQYKIEQQYNIYIHCMWNIGNIFKQQRNTLQFSIAIIFSTYTYIYEKSYDPCRTLLVNN